MSYSVSNPDCKQDSVSLRWTHTADLTLPDGRTGRMSIVIDDAAQTFWKALITSDINSSLWITPAGPVVDADVTRLLGVLTIGQMMHDATAASTVTDHSGPGLTG